MESYYRRSAEQDWAAREAAGDDIWSRGCDGAVRERLWAMIEAMLSQEGLGRAVVGALDLKLRIELGIRLDFDPRNAGSPERYFERSFKTFDDRVFPTVVELLRAELTTHRAWYDNADGFINRVFAEERIALRLVDGQMVDFGSEELHEEVVAPAVRLLHRRGGWEAVDKSYRDALGEIGVDPEDAITDAGRALQEALTLLGCKGGSLGPLARSAKDKGLLGPHDIGLTDGVEKIVHWVSADRSERGESHKTSGATRDDAWLAVHVVGALIFRLSQYDDGQG